MKTITTLLMTCFLLAETFNTVLAGDDARSERSPRQRNEIKFKREMYVDACPICYNPLHDGKQGCSLEALAWMETNRIALALELSDHQRNRIFEINYRYITHHYNGDYYPTSRRDREIRHILRLGQLVAFAILLNELHHGEVCYNCSNEAF